MKAHVTGKAVLQFNSFTNYNEWNTGSIAMVFH